MPASLTEQNARREAIREILARRAIANQSELVAALEEAGISATQSVVSRDLRSLRVVKTGGVYRHGLIRAVHEIDDVAAQIRSLRVAGECLIVATTPTGAAARVALMIDRADHSDIAGTIAGDDTIFIAVDGRSAQERVLGMLRQLDEETT